MGTQAVGLGQPAGSARPQSWHPMGITMVVVLLLGYINNMPAVISDHNTVLQCSPARGGGHNNYHLERGRLVGLGNGTLPYIEGGGEEQGTGKGKGRNRQAQGRGGQQG